MRPRPSIAAYVRLCAVSGLGVYLGASLAGLVAVATGQVFAPRSTWLGTVPALAVVGAPVGAAVCWLTRRWLLPRLGHRWWVFVAAGIVTLPLFGAISQFRAVESVGVPLIVVGGVAMLVGYLRSTGRSARPPRVAHSEAGSR